MAKIIREQLTLFVPKNSGDIELVRAKFNPVQHRLIKAHITICREDEIKTFQKIKANLVALVWHPPLHIELGRPQRFQDSKGVLIPATSQHQFDSLRRIILDGVNHCPRQHIPHITLMHPRNSECTDQLFELIQKYNFPTSLSFAKISHIAQVDGGPWKTLAEYPLMGGC